ncbi:phosphatase PAP2/dual specificity phosphatase family protein [Cupriavidus sp. 2TAF22]|uniref:phosphatase PAP2/dual specificity phosphatase family protein n=1 Tax=unclassified Cupriavidus TaxID=2640874 RepID=UPI003F8FEDEC
MFQQQAEGGSAGTAPRMDVAETRPWGLALALLCAMGVLFFSSYGFANWLASLRADVPYFYFGWERHIPFVPWSIVPYWSIDLLYGLSFFLWRTRAALITHARRLLAAQLISVACFIAFPLRFAFERPPADGLPGRLFALLGGFDKPFNQAPSLHISLLVILWVAYAMHARGAWRWLLHVWFALIGISVLTTYQHHAIDLPTGWLVGWFCVFLFPLGQGERRGVAGRGVRTRQLSVRYAAGALGAGALALAVLPASALAALLLGWLALALACVAAIYRRGLPALFQKGPDGSMPMAARWVLAPYQLGAFANSRWWTRGRPQASEIVPGIWVGRFPDAGGLRRLGAQAVLDLTAELPRLAPAGIPYRCVPVLDLTVPPPAQLDEAVAILEAWHGERRTVLVCCALGYSRSALVAAAWLAARTGARAVDEPLALLRKGRPQVVLRADSVAALADFIGRRQAAQSSEGTGHGERNG